MPTKAEILEFTDPLRSPASKRVPFDSSSHDRVWREGKLSNFCMKAQLSSMRVDPTWQFLPKAPTVMTIALEITFQGIIYGGYQHSLQQNIKLYQKTQIDSKEQSQEALVVSDIFGSVKGHFQSCTDWIYQLCGKRTWTGCCRTWTGKPPGPLDGKCESEGHSSHPVPGTFRPQHLLSP